MAIKWLSVCLIVVRVQHNFTLHFHLFIYFGVYSDAILFNLFTDISGDQEHWIT